MEEDLRTLILDAPSVPSRVHWVTRPQGGELPAVVLHMISSIPDYHMRGPSGLVVARVQVSVIAATYAEVKSVTRAIVARLSGYSGTVGTGTRFDMIAVVGERDLHEAGGNDAERMFRVVLDLQVYHRKTTVFNDVFEEGVFA